MAALFIRQCRITICSGTLKVTSRSFAFRPTGYVDDLEQDRRYRKGLSRNPNAYGPLTDNRDFSYVDGRPVPIGVGQSERVLKHRKYAEKILQCVKEMDFAVERHQRLQREAEEQKQSILNGKLKVKGHLLLKNPTGKT